MAKTVVGYFDDFAQAERAVHALVDGGFSRDDISLLISDREGKYAKANIPDQTIVEESGSGIAVGAGTGAAIGGLGGLLIGIGALAIPGVGSVIAAGPLGAALLGAGLGATAGGLIGALVDIGVAEEEARVYAEGVRRGGAVVSLKTEGLMVDRAADILDRHGAVDIDKRVAEWRQSGWTGYDPNAGPYTGPTTRPASSMQTQAPPSPDAMSATAGATSMSAFESYDTDFRNNFTTTYGSRGFTYDRYEPAYRYGYTLAGNRKYSGRDWNVIEADARRDWERNNQGAWEDFKDAIRYAWNKVRGYPASRAA